MAWTSNTFAGLKPLMKDTYSKNNKPAKGVTLRTKPEDVNQVPKKFNFAKLKTLMKI